MRPHAQVEGKWRVQRSVALVVGPHGREVVAQIDHLLLAGHGHAAMRMEIDDGLGVDDRLGLRIRRARSMCLGRQAAMHTLRLAGSSADRGRQRRPVSNYPSCKEESMDANDLFTNDTLDTPDGLSFAAPIDLRGHWREVCQRRCVGYKARQQRRAQLEALGREELLETALQQLAAGDLEEVLRDVAVGRPGVDWDEVLRQAAGRMACRSLADLVQAAGPLLRTRYASQLFTYIHPHTSHDAGPESAAIDELFTLERAIGMRMLGPELAGMAPWARLGLEQEVGEAVVNRCHLDLVVACEHTLNLWEAGRWEELYRQGAITAEAHEHLQRDYPTGNPKYSEEELYRYRTYGRRSI
jgi:hypothetical protein